MILEMTAGVTLLYGASRGTGPSATFVDREWLKTTREFRSAQSTGPAHLEAMEELLGITEECYVDGWAGKGSVAVDPETYRKAYRLLECLPGTLPSPSVGAEADGHLTFEWYTDPQNQISISVSPEGELHWAAFVRGAQSHGSEPNLGTISEYLLSIIKRVVQKSNATLPCF